MRADAGRTSPAHIPGLPPLGTVSNIEPSRFDAGTAYVTIDLHQVNNRDPFVYKTTDYGETWKSIAGDLPKSLHSYAHCVREDPVEEGTALSRHRERALFLGRRRPALAAAAVRAAARAGALDDRPGALQRSRRRDVRTRILHPRRHHAAAAADARRAASESAHLFEPRAAYRFRLITDPMMMPDDPTEGKNPPDGAAINFMLKTAPAKRRRRQGEGRRGEDRDQRRERARPCAR